MNQEPAQPSEPQNPEAATGKTGTTAAAAKIVSIGLALHTGLQHAASSWMPVFDDLARYVLPRHPAAALGHDGQGSSFQQESPADSNRPALRDTTAIRENNRLADTQSAWVTDPNSVWFQFTPPVGFEEDDAIAAWCSDATDKARRALASSNFYEIVHEFYASRSGTGTAAMHVHSDTPGKLVFGHWITGSYFASNGADGTVDVVTRSVAMTAHRAAALLGVKNLPADMAKLLAEQDPKAHTEKHEFIHQVTRRPESEVRPWSLNPAHMPWADRWIAKEDNHLVRDGGFYEMPIFVSRFQGYGESAYGWCPGIQAFPEILDLQEARKDFRDGIKKGLNPPLIVPDSIHIDDVDYTEAGVTFFRAGTTDRPTTWGSEANLAAAQAEIETLREDIKAAYFGDLTNIFDGVNREMTATEITARTSERTLLFTASFARLQQEFLEPLLRRIFAMLLRDGTIPAPPESIVPEADPSAVVAIPPPAVEYSSRMAIALAVAAQAGADRTLSELAPLQEAGFGAFDHFDIDAIARNKARLNGMDERLMIPAYQVADNRKAAAEAAAAQAQAEA